MINVKFIYIPEGDTQPRESVVEIDLKLLSSKDAKIKTLIGKQVQCGQNDIEVKLPSEIGRLFDHHLANVVKQYYEVPVDQPIEIKGYIMFLTNTFLQNIFFSF